MKIRILGCGGSFGSPLAWNRNGKVNIDNQYNFRNLIIIKFFPPYAEKTLIIIKYQRNSRRRRESQTIFRE